MELTEETRWVRYGCPSCGRIWLVQEFWNGLDSPYFEEVESPCRKCGDLGVRLKTEDN